ncbi:hypothetical protein LCM20_17615 [Halobacillus litoralis]|uniref:hypothetical protein n=1 Tax=Halobacillus litoralis TaxID=45668 RepID=UPI001CD724DC|nr:hypothetical protein [Halobacillus litoralis]MCA0972416.1 hypothetical protein [Halobacillus litoralis]
MNPAINGLKYLLSSKKTLLHSTFDMNDYARVSHALKAEGVPFRTASYSSPRPNGAAYQDVLVQYDIYVKKKDQHRATEAIRQGR